ncbi:MAG: hypothetical protein VZR28_10060 [Candidatus Cryptobacteroides sp.]|nr:hypothetical protein [Candidatus Cryptobacteroides sp.]
MKRYKILDAKVGETAGGIACGPVPGAVVVAVQVDDGEKKQWLTTSTYDVYCNISMTDDDIFDKVIETNFTDEELCKKIEESSIADFDISEFDNDAISASVKGIPEDQAVLLVAYILLLAYCDRYNIDWWVNRAKGKYIDELTTPIVSSLIQMMLR